MAIKSITAQKILDSRGMWDDQVTLTLDSGDRVIASMPQGKSTGSHEAAAVDVNVAIKNIETIIATRVIGMDPANQREIDELLIALDGTPSKERLGANAILAVSVACAKAAALEAGIPLWSHIRALAGISPESARDCQMREGVTHPRLYMNMVNGGAHAGNNLDFQEYLIIPKADTFIESISIGEHIYHEAGEALKELKGDGAVNIGDEGGYAPDFSDNLEPFKILMSVVAKLGMTDRVDVGLDAAATGIKLSDKELNSAYTYMAEHFPLIYLEDPFDEEAFEKFAGLRKKLGEKIAIAGDDLTTTNVSRMGQALSEESISAVIIKPNQIGTLSETLDAVRFAREQDWSVVVSHRSGETNDDFIADLAYGVIADGFKLGAPARGERIAKYNRLLAIEKEALE